MKNKYFSFGFFLTSRFTSETHESGVYRSIFPTHGGTPPSSEDGIALAGSSITQSSDINPGRSNFKVFYLNVFLRMIIFKIPILRLIFWKKKNKFTKKYQNLKKAKVFFLEGFFSFGGFFFWSIVVSGLEENCC